MSLLSRVARAMHKIAPLELAEQSWDNVGILVEPVNERSAASKVFLTIDLTPQVLKEALSDDKVGAIVAYHPPIFKAMKSLTQTDPKQKMILETVAAGVGIYSPHTACDNCCNGVNDWLASGFGLGEGSVQPIIRAEKVPDGQEGAGSGRLFTFTTPTSLNNVIQKVKALTGLDYVRVARAEKHETGDIKTVAICAGSGSSVLNTVDADLYFSGEMGHHDVLAALAQGTSVILCEHTNTERGYLSAVLKPALEEKLAADDKSQTLTVVVSERDRDPLQIA